MPSRGWVVARIYAGMAVDDRHLSSLPPGPWRDLAGAMLAANGAGREAAFETYLADCGEAEEIRAEVFRADPTEADDEPLSVYAGQVRTLADALQPREVIPSTVKGIIASQSLNCLFGPPGTLKTALLIDLCFCVALGRDWLEGLPDRGGFAGYPVVQCPALWVDLDNGEAVMYERLAAFGRAYAARADFDGISLLTFPDPPIDASKGLKQLGLLARQKRAGLIVIDNLLNIAGVRDENSSEMGSVMKNLRQLTAATRAAVVVIHHTTKDNDSETIRGHSSIEAGFDSTFYVKRREPSDPTITLKHKKVRRNPVKPFGAMFSFEHGADGETLHTARFWGTQPPDLKAEAVDELKARILAALQDGPINTTELQRGFKCNRDTLTQALNQLVAEETVCREEGKNNAKLYRLAGPESKALSSPL